jgi:hypothetical protein
MALANLRFQPWTLEADLHVVSGVPSAPFGQTLKIDDTPPTPGATAQMFDWDQPPPHIEVQIVPRFEPSGPQSPGVRRGHGVSVDLRTGVVTVEAVPPGTRRLHNFLLTFTARDRNTGTAVSRTIRVHVHDRLVRAWLTPSTLTVRPDAHVSSFSLLAEFDDKVIGDIRGWLPLAWSTDPPPPASPAVGDIELFSDTAGWFRGHRAGAEATVTVTYAPMPWPDPPPTARVVCREPWGTPRELTWVGGKDPAKWQDARNVLFLPDGFTDGETELFETLVRTVVRKLRTSTVLRPFDLIHDEMNFWAAFVPSPQAGVNVLHEVYTSPGHGGTMGTALPFPSAPQPTAAAWSLEELIHQVGLPVAADAGRPLTGPPAARPLLQDWQEIYGQEVTEARVKNRWESWRALATRTLLNERDTLFGITLGSRPRVEANTAVRIAQLPSAAERADLSDLARLVESLTHKGQLVGLTWRVDSTNPGKDRGLVAILSRTRLNGGTNLGSFFVSTLYSADSHLVEPAPAGGLDIRPVRIKFKSAPLPAGEQQHPYVDADEPPFELVGTVAHEAAHSLHVGDEYGEVGDRSHRDSPNVSLARWGNLQERQSLLVDGQLAATAAKWARWHRIEQAGVLAQDADPPRVARDYRLTLRPGHARAFKQGDLVRLRRRPMVPDTVVSDVMRVLGTPAPGQAHLDVTVVFGDSTSPGHFLAGSVLLKMLRWPFRGLGDNLGDELKLMATIIRDHITTTHRPLNASPDRPLDACDLDDAAEQSARNLPDGLPKCRPSKRNRIVGLFEGGDDYHCGVYHPTGACVMRARRKSRDDELIPFCPVCRYVLVDLIDPTKHGVIDREYAKIYPDPRL